MIVNWIRLRYDGDQIHNRKKATYYTQADTADDVHPTTE